MERILRDMERVYVKIIGILRPLDEPFATQIEEIVDELDFSQANLDD